MTTQERVLHVIDIESQIEDADDFANVRSFPLERHECVPLELKLNKSSKNKVWSFIGDHLYNFGCKIENTSDTLLLTTSQFDFLVVLQNTPNWRECVGL